MYTIKCFEFYQANIEIVGNIEKKEKETHEISYEPLLLNYF